MRILTFSRLSDLACADLWLQGLGFRFRVYCRAWGLCRGFAAEFTVQPPTVAF